MVLSTIKAATKARDEIGISMKMSEGSSSHCGLKTSPLMKYTLKSNVQNDLVFF
jgi:hypothetical protein